MTELEQAQSFIYRNARPLDLARWQYHFEGGSRDTVLAALAYYQNEDGGFGHALEADCWNPQSAPIQTWTATELLREVGHAGPAHPLVQGILRYLGSGQDFDGHIWASTLPGNNDGPHAPWWHWESGRCAFDDYNPTACLAGFLVRFAPQDSGPYQLGCRVAREAAAHTGWEQDMHSVQCYVGLLAYLREAGRLDLAEEAGLARRVHEAVRAVITQDTAQWATGYICRPSQFFCTRDSEFYPENRAIANYECDFIRQTQQPDGAWSVNWSWGSYPEQWAVSKNWWKANGVIRNLLYLRGMEKSQ